MKKVVFLVMLTLVLAFPGTVRAIVNPMDSPNNRFGIHIIDPVDLDDAATLVNSSGGEWGYVTLVIRENQRDRAYWQEVFDRMEFRKLIPIVRIATVQQDGGWKKPDLDDIAVWVQFLDGLFWPTKNRYIVIGNEPNHAGEWGGEVNPAEYVDYLVEFSKQLRAASDEFFVLPAGLDASAPNGIGHMRIETFLWEMTKTEPEWFEYIDGWSSHSYPNPGFEGSADDSGKTSIRGYLWELEYLSSNYGLDTSKMPVFITETGWKIDGGNLASKYKTAFLEAWDDPRVIAVTPFILSYPEGIFENFSWKDGNGEYREFYWEMAGLPKLAGRPVMNGNYSVNPSLAVSSLACVQNEPRNGRIALRLSKRP